MKKMYGIITLVLSSVLILSGCYNKDSRSERLSSVPEDNIITATAEQSEKTEPTFIPAETPTPVNGSLEVHYIDVGQADSSLVMCDGEAMLIDGGNAEDSDLIAAYLKKENVSTLDYLVCTHAHEDHCGGLSGALSVVEVENVLAPNTEADTEVYQNFKDKTAAQGLTIQHPSAGDSFMLGSANVQIVGPITEYTFDRTKPFEEFLEHIKELRDNIYEYDKTDELDEYSELTFLNDNYSVIAYTGDILDINSLGILPLRKIEIMEFPYKHVEIDRPRIKYASKYIIKNEMLFLSDLYIKNHSVKLPVLNGVVPNSENYIKAGHAYNGVDLRLEYTGSIIFGRNYRKISKNKDFQCINLLFGWKDLVMLNFDNGKVMDIKDMSLLAGHIRKLRILFPALPYITRLSPLFRQLWRDSWYRNEPPQEVYRYYSEYIKICNHRFGL